MEASKAIFLDKDGTLIPDIPYNVNPDLITISDDAIAGLRSLQEAGYLLVIITNQSGIAKGMFGFEELCAVKDKIEWLLKESHIDLAGFYFCPHDADASSRDCISCQCRKPSPGLLVEAANDLGIILEESWMIGDILNDVEAGHRAGCRSILIENGNETEWEMSAGRTPDGVFGSINQAAAHIMNFKQLGYEGISAVNRQV